MPDDFRPFNSGESLPPRFTPGWLNAVNRAAQAARSGNIQQGQQILAAASGCVTVRVVNKSGADIDRPGGVLKIDGLAFDYEDNPNQVFSRPVVKGITPTSDTPHFVVLEQPLISGGVA